MPPIDCGKLGIYVIPREAIEKLYREIHSTTLQINQNGILQCSSHLLEAQEKHREMKNRTNRIKNKMAEALIYQ